MGKFGIKNIWDIQPGSNVNTDNLVTTNTTQSITAVKTFTALPQSSVAPTNANDLVNKAYVDSIGGDWVKIIDNVAVNTTNDSGMTEARGWTNNLHDFTYQTRHTYLVTCKITNLQNNTDVCGTTVIQTNSGTYDNLGQIIIYDNTGTHALIIQIHLGNTESKQNRIYYHLPSGYSKSGNLALYAWIKDLGDFENS